MFCQASGIAQLPAKWVKTLWVTRMGRGRHQSTPPSGKYLLCSWGNEGRVLERMCSASGGLIFLRNRSVPRTRNLLRLVKGKGLTEQTLWNLTGPQDIMGLGARSGSIFSGGASSSVPWFSLLSTILSQGYSKILLYFPHPWFQRGFGLLQKPHVKPDSDFVALELTTLWWSFLSLGSRNWMGKILVAVGFGCFTPPTSLKIVLSPKSQEFIIVL